MMIAMIAAAALTVGCAGTPTEPSAPVPSQGGIWPGTVTAVASSSDIRITNQTERPISYVAFEQELAARVQFAACANGPQCASIVQGATGVLPWSGVGGYDPDKRTYLLYWWQLITEADGTVHVGSIQTIQISR